MTGVSFIQSTPLNKLSCRNGELRRRLYGGLTYIVRLNQVSLWAKHRRENLNWKKRIKTIRE